MENGLGNQGSVEYGKGLFWVYMESTVYVEEVLEK